MRSTNVTNIIRPEIASLSAYHVPDSAGFLKLDAMENPFALPPTMQQELGQHLAQVAMNRYPVPSYASLKHMIADKLGVPAGHDIIVGNGSDELAEILNAVGDSGVVVVDEAYQPFAPTSFMSRLDEFDNLVVMRTVSKLGLAGIRLGYMAGNNVLMNEFEKVRPPYNVNVLTQAAAEFVLQRVEVLDAQAAELRAQRTQLAAALSAMEGVQVFPSSANFLLIRVANAEQLFVKLLNHKILVKNVGKMHTLLENCLRITVSTQEENAQFLAAFAASMSSK